jgi:hypothetical protein
MERQVIEIASLDRITGAPPGPCRVVLPGPLKGGPLLREVRAKLAPLGKLRLSGSRAHTFADLDPGAPEEPLLALDMIVREDEAGLERLLLSAINQVDEIVIGIDERTTDGTRRVAEAYADVVHSFSWAAIGLTEEEWRGNKIHFANARNIGRAVVKAPWTMFLDSDEYLSVPMDLRDEVRKAIEAKQGALSLFVNLGEFGAHDVQRIAKTEYRWFSQTHNQLSIVDPAGRVDGVIMHDTTLRTAKENARRELQRDDGMSAQREEADKGNLTALFHLVKHQLGCQREEGVELAKTYRLKAEVHGALSLERAWAAYGVAAYYYNREEFQEAELWCLRALLDGPLIECLCLLGDIAEDMADLPRARAWYEAACATPEAWDTREKIEHRAVIEMRHGRLSGLRRALGKSDPRLDMQKLVDEWRAAGFNACADQLAAILKLTASKLPAGLETVAPSLPA